MKSTLYKRSRSGKLQIWTIETEENRYRTTEGYIDGLQTPTEWTSCSGKRIGSTNEVSPNEQSIKEAESRVKKQREKGWTEDIDNVDEAAMKISPMLAHKFVENEEYVLSLPHIALQAKLDGARTIGTKKGLFTRTGKPIFTAPHIFENVKQFLENLDTEGEIFCDGEFYNNDFHDDFNAIISIFKKQKPTQEDLEKSRELGQYHVYDLDIKNLVSFRERYESLQSHVLAEPDRYPYIHVVPTIFLDNTKRQITREILQEYRDRFIEQGYEGVMIRNADASYQNCRTKDLLKWKEFQDAEFTLIDVMEGRGNRAGIAARVYCRDNKGEKFFSGLRGTVDYCRDLLKNKDQYIGKQVTIRFQNYTPDRQVPRFGKMLVVRDYE